MQERGKFVQIVTVISIASLLLVGSLVGVRLLLLARRTRQLPEFAIGLGMLGDTCLGPPLCAVGRLPTLVGTPFGDAIFALGLLLAVCGIGCFYIFTWRVFRPEDLWAQGIVAAALLALAMQALGLLDAGWGAESMEALLPRTRPWACGIVATVAVCFSWSGSEALYYRGKLRRRQELGLADPVIANRFTLWAVSGYLVALLCAGLEFSMLAGRAPLHDPLPLSLISAAAGVASVAWLLAFAPPERYLRWVRSRSDRSLGLPV